MAPPSDLVEKARRALRRRWRLILAPLFVAESAYGIAQVYFETVLQGMAIPLWLVVYFVAVPPISFFALWYVFRRSDTQTIEFLERVRPRTRDIEVARLGLVLAFDNRVVLQVAQNTLRFWMFFGPTGSPLETNVADFSALMKRARGMRRVGTLNARKRSVPPEAELDRIRTALGGRWGLFLLFRRRPGILMRPADDSSRGFAAFYVPRWYDKSSVISPELDTIRRFLEAAETYFPKSP